MAELPVNGELLNHCAAHDNDQAAADALSDRLGIRVPRETLRDHINRLGMREAINAARGFEPVARPPEIPLIRRDYSHLDELHLYPLGDVHLGDPAHNSVLWQRTLNRVVNDPKASLLCVGDMLNSAILGSKSDVYGERYTVGDAKRKMRDQLRPLAQQGRLDGMVPGNHEDRITRATGDCPIKDITDALGVPYVPAAALFVYSVGGCEYEVYLRHGTGLGQALSTLSKSGNVIRADIYITGHNHRQAVTVDDVFEREGETVARSPLYFLSAGSFQGYAKYAAQRGYPPSRVGAPRVTLGGEHWGIEVTV